MSYLQKHKVSSAIVLFVSLFLLFHWFKPSFAYTESGGFRPFGVGYRNKTVFPIWAVAIALAVFSYFVILQFFSL
jgi:hypothetical protein